MTETRTPTEIVLEAVTDHEQNDTRKLLHALDAVERIAANIRKSLDPEQGGNDLSWWADHTQGLVYNANQAESLLNRVLAWREAAADTQAIDVWIKNLQES